MQSGTVCHTRSSVCPTCVRMCIHMHDMIMCGRRRGTENSVNTKRLPTLPGVKFRRNHSGTMAHGLIGGMQAQFEAFADDSYMCAGTCMQMGFVTFVYVIYCSALVYGFNQRSLPLWSPLPWWCVCAGGHQVPGARLLRLLLQELAQKRQQRAGAARPARAAGEHEGVPARAGADGGAHAEAPRGGGGGDGGAAREAAEGLSGRGAAVPPTVCPGHCCESEMRAVPNHRRRYHRGSAWYCAKTFITPLYVWTTRCDRAGAPSTTSRRRCTKDSELKLELDNGLVFSPSDFLYVSSLHVVVTNVIVYRVTLAVFQRLRVSTILVATNSADALLCSRYLGA